LRADDPHRLAAASEVALGEVDDDRRVVDALVRLRADLGAPDEPTRVATFPQGSVLHRLDATGLTAGELIELRWSLHHDHGVGSTVLLDDGPRRWLVAVRWDETAARRLEELTERAGFRDVTVEPSPIALVRVLDEDVTRVRRDAAIDESFELLCRDSIPVAASSVDAIGRMPPDLALDTAAVPTDWFTGTIDPSELTAELRRFTSDLGPGDPDRRLTLAGTDHPSFPPHDLRSPQRQCVALGAALGAAGLAGRLRPVDMVARTAVAPSAERPWAVERVSALPPRPRPVTIGPVRRALSRMLPRRR
jgi:hypothetical protein